MYTFKKTLHDALDCVTAQYICLGGCVGVLWGGRGINYYIRSWPGDASIIWGLHIGS